MGEQERVTCGCGQCEVVAIHEPATTIMGVYCAGRNTDAWVWRTGTPQAMTCVFADDNEDAENLVVAHCVSCGAHLSFDASGKPVARAMRPVDETLEESIARQQVEPFDWRKLVGSLPDPELWEGFDEWLAEERGHGEPMVPRAALDKVLADIKVDSACPPWLASDYERSGLRACASCPTSDGTHADCWKAYRDMLLVLPTDAEEADDE